MGEHLKDASQEINKVHQIAACPPIRLSQGPVIVGQLDKLIDFLVEFGIYFSFCRVSGILRGWNTAVRSDYRSKWPYMFKFDLKFFIGLTL